MNHAKTIEYVFGLCRLYKERKMQSKNLQVSVIASVYNKVKEELGNSTILATMLHPEEWSQAKISKSHEIWNLDGEDLAVLCNHAFHVKNAKRFMSTEELVLFSQGVCQFIDGFKLKTRAGMTFEEVERHINQEIDKFVKVARHIGKVKSHR